MTKFAKWVTFVQMRPVQITGSAKATDYFVRDGPSQERHPEHGLLRSLTPLPDCLRNLVRFAKPHTNPPLRIAHDDDRIEAEPPSTLHNLGHSVDVHNLIEQLQSCWIDSFLPNQ